MKKRFLQPRVTPVSLDADKSPCLEDRRYAEQRTRGLGWLRFDDRLETEYRRQSGSLGVRRAFTVALLGLSAFLAATLEWTTHWAALATSVTLGWIALLVAAYHSRHAFLIRSELQQQAQVDGLTGAMNRRGFHEHLELIWRQAERDGRTVGLMLLDIDHFKQLNDRHGHLAGDTVLRATAQILKSYALRPLDAVGRYGGDEFMVAWYDAQPGAFSQLVQLLPAKIWMGLAGIGLRDDITASGGAVLARPGAEVSIDRVLQAADEQLYRIKHGYRGSIAMAPQVLESATPETASGNKMTVNSPGSH